MKLTALITVYNEAKFLDCCLNSIKDHVDKIVIVEGAYQETIRLGKPKRSDDGTIEIINAHSCDLSDVGVFPPNSMKFFHMRANEESDAQQRNVGLEVIKKNDSDFFVIIDGDEVYKPYHFKMIRMAMSRPIIDAWYFTCNTFVNDFNHYCKQSFLRLFRLYDDAEFINDNFITSNGRSWQDIPKAELNVNYFHYAFLKGKERFETKKKWWESRFGENKFHYDWNVNDKGMIKPENHEVYEYIGSHPAEIIRKFNL